MDNAAKSVDLSGLRKPYSSTVLLESELPSTNPSTLFHSWFEEIKKESLSYEEINAICLSTVSREGKPSSRMILLKAYGPDGFSFYTNYNSRKGLDLAHNPNGCILMYWPKVNRQVRVEGKVIQLPASAADEYWAKRPLQSTASAVASQQSAPVQSRQVLEQKVADIIKEAGPDEKVPRPEHWGGYLLVPEYWEFWQGQSDRLHDRFIFRRPAADHKPDEFSHSGEGGWIYERLAP